MVNIIKKITILIILALVALPNYIFGNEILGPRNKGPYAMFEQIIFRAKQERILSYISDDCARGRATATLGNGIIREYIKKTFIKYGLKPYNDKYYIQRFMCADSIKGANIIGMIPSTIKSDEYIIVSAHYDHIGALNGYIYNGADDNASGVTALMNLAEIFSTMKKAKLGPHKNIIFAVFDAKEKSMSGSRYFVENLKIDKKKIITNINIDQIGSTLEPVHKGVDNYAIILGENSLKKKNRGKLELVNKFYNLDLDIDYTFYGSEAFTDIFYKLSDQVAFSENGIPAILLTSGFTKHTYKTTDDVNLINYDILKNRTLLVFYFIMHL